MVLAQLADRVRPLKRVEYWQMVELGMFKNERVELLRGYIVQIRPQKMMPDYTGPDINLDFDANNVLLGIEILA